MGLQNDLTIKLGSPHPDQRQRLVQPILGSWRGRIKLGEEPGRDAPVGGAELLAGPLQGVVHRRWRFEREFTLDLLRP